MAEDKRIRVSVDYSELDQLREKIRSLTFELNRMGENFGGVTPDRFQAYANQVIGLQEQALRSISSSDNQFRAFDRAWDRFSMGYQAANPDWRSRLTPTEPLSPGASGRVTDAAGNRGFWGRVTDFLSRIAQSLEKKNRDRENGEVPVGDTPSREPQNTPTPPTPQQPPTPGGGVDRVDWGEALKNFKLPTSIGSILGMFAGGAILAQIGAIVGQQFQFSAQQYGLGDDFQRNINRGNNPLLNAMTFGITGAEASKRMHAYQISRQFDQSVLGYSQMAGVGYNEGLGALYNLGGALSGGSRLDSRLWGESGAETETADDRLRRMAGGDSTAAKVLAIGGGSTYGGTAQMNTNYVATGRFDGGEDVGGFGLKNWASRNLGLDVSEYLQKYTQFARAGLTAENTRRDSSLNQLMIAQRYRGLSDIDIEGIQRATRFSSNRTGAQVTSALDEQLQRYAQNVLGYGGLNTSLYASTMLPEMMQRFSTFANSALLVQGSYDAAGILRQMSSIQNATGAQGPQLERYQDALMGRGVSQDDVTQALLLRTARQLNPEGSYTDLMADVESFRAGDNSKLAKQFYDQIVKVTGGKGEQFRTIMKSVYGDRLSWNDIIDIEKGGATKAEELLGGGSSTGSGYSAEQAARTLSPAEISAAETRNRQGMEGHTEVYSQLGLDLKQVLNGSQIAKDISEIATGFKDVLLEYVAQKIEESRKNSPYEGQYKVNMMSVQVDVTGE